MIEISKLGGFILNELFAWKEFPDKYNNLI